MQQTGGSTLPPREVSKDITFACPHCSASFVVDIAGAGMKLDCQKCGKPISVPTPVVEPKVVEPAREESVELSNLRRHLKENESQRVEITGYINQLSIQLHRWQLRLQTLKERQEKLQAELATTSGGSTDKSIEAPAATPSAAPSSG